MADKFVPQGGGVFDLARPYLYDFFGIGKKKEAPKPPSDDGKKKTASDDGKKQKKQEAPPPQDLNAGIQVIPRVPPAQGRPISEDAVDSGGDNDPFGRRGPPLSIREAKAIAEILGYNFGAGIPAPPDIVPPPLPEGYHVPLDVRPVANWIDQNYGTKYLQGTPGPDDYMKAALDARSLLTGGPAMEQAQAQARLAEYKALLHQQDLPALIKAIHGGRGLTLGDSLPPGATDNLPVEPPAGSAPVPAPTPPPAPAPSAATPPAAGAPVVPAGTAPAPKKGSNLSPAQRLNLAKYNNDLDIQNRQGIQKYQEDVNALPSKYGKIAREDPFLSRFNTMVVPGVAGVRKLLDPKIPIGQIDGTRALAAIQQFQKTLVDPGVGVHLGDIENIAALQSTFDGAANVVMSFVNGNKAIGPDARDNMLNAAAELFSAIRASAQKRIQQLKIEAASEGLPPKKFNTVVPDVLPGTVRFFLIKDGKQVPYDIPREKVDKKKEKWRREGIKFIEMGH